MRVPESADTSAPCTCDKPGVEITAAHRPWCAKNGPVGWTFERPHYTTGVIAQCDRCGEVDVLIVTERDYMDEAIESACRACVEGWDECSDA